MSDDEITNDAELIERARRAAEATPYISAYKLLMGLADRLAELTKPEPWRSPSELPVAIRDRAMTLVKRGRDVSVVCDDSGSAREVFEWLNSLVGWKPIVRPEP